MSPLPFSLHWDILKPPQQADIFMEIFLVKLRLSSADVKPEKLRVILFTFPRPLDIFAETLNDGYYSVFSSAANHSGITGMLTWKDRFQCLFWFKRVAVWLSARF